MSRPHTGSADAPARRLRTGRRRCAAAIYMYEFAWRSPQHNGLLDACHALDIPFVFDVLGDAGAGPVRGSMTPRGDLP